MSIQETRVTKTIEELIEGSPFSPEQITAARELLAESDPVLRDDAYANSVVDSGGWSTEAGIYVPDLGDFLHARQLHLQSEVAKAKLMGYSPETVRVVSSVAPDKEKNL